MTAQTTAYVELPTGLYKVLDVAQYGEDENVGLVDVLVERVDRTELFWTVLLAEDIHVHVDPAVALVGAMLWHGTKYGD